MAKEKLQSRRTHLGSKMVNDRYAQDGVEVIGAVGQSGNVTHQRLQALLPTNVTQAGAVVTPELEWLKEFHLLGIINPAITSKLAITIAFL